MFFADRIVSINKGDRVLEIGPGSDPHPRSDVLLEKKYETSEEYFKQLGHSTSLETEKEVVYYEGDIFPFADKEFDYVICSHVLEHVTDLPQFLSEVFRVASKGYFEFPLVYYEYLYNINAHENVLKFDNSVLKYMKKNELPFDSFKPVQEFLLQSLQRGHVDLVNELLEFMIDGFEWHEKFKFEKVNSISQLTWQDYSLPWPKKNKAPAYTYNFLIRQFIKKVIGSK